MLLTAVGAPATAAVATAASAARVVASRVAGVLGIAALRAIRAVETPIIVHIACMPHYRASEQANLCVRGNVSGERRGIGVADDWASEGAFMACR